MTSSLHFYVNSRKDREYIKKYFPVFKKIFGKKNFEKMIKKYGEKRDLKVLKNEMVKIERKWRRVENRFFKVTEEKFGKWRRKIYFCHVSSTYICGGGYEYPTIIVFPFSEHVNPLETIIHELLHLHIIENVKRLNLKPKNWIEFSEIAVGFMSKEIGNQLNLSILFPNNKIERKFKMIEKRLGKEMAWNEKLVLIEKLIK